MMETLIDDNFLNGKLTIVSKPEANITLGRFEIYDDSIDDILEFNTYTICKEDSFDKHIGIKIVRLKIAKEFYKYRAKINKICLSKVEHTTKSIQTQLNYINKKLAHIEYELKKFV